MSKWLSHSSKGNSTSVGSSQEKVSYVVDPMEGEEITPELSRLLNRIRENFVAEKFYVDVGETVVAIKEPDSMFKNKAMISKREHLLKRAGNIWKQRFQEMTSEEEHVHQLLSTPKAHPFSKVNEALKVLKEKGESQILMTKGISGSGKSIISELLIQQLLLVGDPKSAFSDNVSHVSVLLNAFGNAQTASNANSTRMAKLCEVNFDKDLQAVAVNFQTALLEKSRLACVPFHERNFDIFHQLCEGLSKVEGGSWKDFAQRIDLARNPEDFLYLRPEKFEPITASPKEWNGMSELQQTLDAFSGLGFTRKEVEDVFQTLSIILHFGNLKMKQRKSSEGCVVDVKNQATAEALQTLSKLLQIDETELEQSLVYSFATVGKGEKIKTTIRRQLAVYALDAFSKGLYDMLILWIVGKANAKLNQISSSESGSQPLVVIGSVSVLDMFGFQREFNESGFETLLVNYANEALQAEFLKAELYANMAHCFDEGFTPPGSELKQNQQVLHQFVKKKRGILRLLNGSTVFDPSETKYREYSMIDQRFLDSLKKGSDGEYVKPLASRPECFLIRHFLGDVVYTARGMVARNHDLVNTGLMSLLHTAPKVFGFVQALIEGCAEIATVHTPEENRKSYVVMYRKAQTISKSSGNVMSGVLSQQHQDDEKELAEDDDNAVNIDVVASSQQKKLKKTIATQFEEQLHGVVLGEWVSGKGVHFVACVSPFAESDGGKEEYEAGYLAAQLQLSGLTAVQEIEDKLYPESFTVEEFVESFRFMLEGLGVDKELEASRLYKLILGRIDQEIDQERSYKRYSQKYNIIRVRGSLLKVLVEMRDGPLEKAEVEVEEEDVGGKNGLKKQVSFGDELGDSMFQKFISRSPSKSPSKSPQKPPQKSPPEFPTESPKDPPVTASETKEMLEEVVNTIKTYVAESTSSAVPASMGKEDADALKVVLQGILDEMKSPSEQQEHNHHFYYHHPENQGGPRPNDSDGVNQALLGNGERHSFHDQGDDDEDSRLDTVCCALVCCQDGLSGSCCCCGPSKRPKGKPRGTCFALICCDSVGKSVRSKPKGGYECFSMNYFCNPLYVCQLWSKSKDE